MLSLLLPLLPLSPFLAGMNTVPVTGDDDEG